MSEPNVDVADRTLMRQQLHTLRERIYVVERRMRDVEMAQDLGATRADVHGDELTSIRTVLNETVVALEELQEKIK